jgi:hypothetical protein
LKFFLLARENFILSGITYQIFLADRPDAIPGDSHLAFASRVAALQIIYSDLE